MTRKVYQDFIYHGKHEKQKYHLWAVLGPTGPVKEYDIFGLDEAREVARKCWDCEITRVCDGKVISTWNG